MILDSGTRREFESGAVRDIQDDKGRCDLMPLDVAAKIAGNGNETDGVLYSLSLFQETGDIQYLYSAVYLFDAFENLPSMLLEVAKHFEEGAKKYNERNWQKGIPVHCYIDSAVRHYLKHSRGDTDERHDRASVWNIMCAIWTCIHIRELNDYPFEMGGSDDGVSASQ